MMTKEQLIEIIQKAPYLDNSAKEYWLARINKEGLSDKFLDDLEGAIQGVIDTLFQETGAGKVNESDAEDIKSYEEMVSGIEKARDKFDNEMAKVSKEISKIQGDTANRVDLAVAQATSQAIKDGLS